MNWIGYLPFALVLLIAVAFFTVRAIRAHRQVSDKMYELENELLKIRGKSDAKHGDPEKGNSHKT